MKTLLLVLCVLTTVTGTLTKTAFADDKESESGIAAPLGSAISYQGKLDKNGVPLNGNCNFTFRLYDALTAGTQVGVTVNITNQPVSAGLFTVALDFGAGAFDGQARWLQIQVQGPGDGSFTTLAPRQAINAAPYALHALNSSSSGLTLPYTGTTSSPSHAFRVGNTLYDVNASGVMGEVQSGVGIWGRSISGKGIYGEASYNYGVHGASGGYNVAGVWGESLHIEGYGGYFTNTAGGTALWADGKVVVKTLQITGGSDLAEPFDVCGLNGEEPPAGSVVVIDPENPGRLMLSDRTYDRRVAGVISGANGLQAGMVLQSDGDPLATGSHPVAMSGRVWCWVDATSGAIRPGDRLTTSSTPGHAMRADDLLAASGAVIGKAMTDLESGRGLVLVLVNLQ